MSSASPLALQLGAVGLQKGAVCSASRICPGANAYSSWLVSVFYLELQTNSLLIGRFPSSFIG